MVGRALTLEGLALDTKKSRRELRIPQANLRHQGVLRIPRRPRPSATPIGMEEVIAGLFAEGVLVEPPAELLAWVDELDAGWKALPETERQAVEEELGHLRLDPPLSEIIIKMRDGWYPDTAE